MSEKTWAISWNTGWAEIELNCVKTITNKTDLCGGEYNEFISTGERISLPHIHAADLLNRQIDGVFSGCNNQSWLLNEDEADGYVRIDAARQANQADQDRQNQIQKAKVIIDKAGVQ